MEMKEIALTAVRGAAMYIALLVVVRVLGKRTLGNVTALDLIVALVLGEVVDEAIFGNVPLELALVAIGAVALVHYLNSYLSFRSPAFDRVVGGAPSVLVRGGRIEHRALARERINEADPLEPAPARAGGIAQ